MKQESGLTLIRLVITITVMLVIAICSIYLGLGITGNILK